MITSKLTYAATVVAAVSIGWTPAPRWARWSRRASVSRARVRRVKRVHRRQASARPTSCRVVMAWNEKPAWTPAGPI